MAGADGFGPAEAARLRTELPTGPLGVVFDARSVCNRTGFSACGFLTNVFALPPTLDEFFALPREAFASADELFDRGWRID